MKFFKQCTRRKVTSKTCLFFHPCRSSLQLHCNRSNYVARIWRSSISCNIDPDYIQNHGWSENGDIIWTDKPLPEDIKSILVNEDISDEDEIEEAEEAMSKSDNDL